MGPRRLKVQWLVAVFVVVNGASYILSKAHLWPDEYFKWASIFLLVGIVLGISIVSLADHKLITLCFVLATMAIFQGWFLKVLALTLFWSVQGFAP